MRLPPGGGVPAVGVGLGEGAGVGVGAGAVGVGDAVVGVGVAEFVSANSRTSWGAVDPVSRLAKFIWVASLVTIAKLTFVPGRTADVTSTLVHWPEAKRPERPMTASPIAGAFWYVMVRSPQVVSATGRSS